MYVTVDSFAFSCCSALAPRQNQTYESLPLILFAIGTIAVLKSKLQAVNSTRKTYDHYHGKVKQLRRASIRKPKVMKVYESKTISRRKISRNEEKLRDAANKYKQLNDQVTNEIFNTFASCSTYVHVNYCPSIDTN